MWGIIMFWKYSRNFFVWFGNLLLGLFSFRMNFEFWVIGWDEVVVWIDGGGCVCCGWVCVGWVWDVGKVWIVGVGVIGCLF